jgi:hypothetical protein
VTGGTLNTRSDLTQMSQLELQDALSKQAQKL